MSDTVIDVDGKEWPTGDLEPRIQCRSCLIYKPISDFHRHARHPQRHNRHTLCKDCRSDMERAKRAANPKVSPRITAKLARQVEVRRLYELNYGPSEIAEQLGVSRSTVNKDVTDMGLAAKRGPVFGGGSAPPKPNVTVADNLVRQLDEMAALVHDGRRVVLDLEGLPISPEMAAEWLKRLAHVGSALRYLRSHAKKGNNP